VAKSSPSPKPTAQDKEAQQRIPEGIAVSDLLRLSRQMGVSSERFERISGHSPDRLRRGRGRSEPVSPEAVGVFRGCFAVFLRAVALCGGDEKAAIQWLTADAPALKGQKPIEAAETPEGLKAVEKLFDLLERAGQ